MKHIFVINPIAGGSDQTATLTNEIKDAFKNINDEYEIYVTSSSGDGEEFVRSTLLKGEGEFTFYACGGDGTTFEVLNGIVGFRNAHLGIISIGSCNDYLKNFPEYDFRTVEKAINGSHKLVDIVKVNDRHMLNVTNIGFDARANADCSRFKKKIKNIKVAYNLSIVKNLLSKMARRLKVEADGKELFDDSFILMTLASGSFYGGGYKCAPRAIVDDGLLDITIVKKISRFKFIKLINTYKRGEHLDSPKLKNIIVYDKVKNVRLKADKPFEVCIDGENYIWDEVEFEVMQKLVSLVIPRS